MNEMSPIAIFGWEEFLRRKEARGRQVSVSRPWNGGTTPRSDNIGAFHFESGTSAVIGLLTSIDRITFQTTSNLGLLDRVRSAPLPVQSLSSLAES